ncbi:MAG TPA: type II secretion system F family protein, partial [Pirellulaceae bacterium]|nr:type II secretion system F family protein [Pirellulaceae bacterium]
WIVAQVIDGWVQYLRTERQVVTLHLLAAVERGLPLESAVRALELDAGMPSLGRVRQLADELSHGVALPEAIYHAGLRLPTGSALAVGVGWEVGNLNDSIRRALRREEELRGLMLDIGQRLGYLTATCILLLVTILFLLIKIIPSQRVMLAEFGLPIPGAVEWLLVSPNPRAVPWDWVVILGGLTIALFVVLLVVGIGPLVRDIPLLGRFTLRADGAWVLRALGWGVAKGKPIDELLAHVEAHFPKRRVKQRLSIARQRIREGRSWTDALRDVGLIRAAEAGVLAAAERVGNLSWALDEVSEGVERRVGYRLRSALAVFQPTMLALLGVVVFLLAYAVVATNYMLVEFLSVTS